MRSNHPCWLNAILLCALWCLAPLPAMCTDDIIETDLSFNEYVADIKAGMHFNNETGKYNATEKCSRIQVDEESYPEFDKEKQLRLLEIGAMALEKAGINGSELYQLGFSFQDPSTDKRMGWNVVDDEGYLVVDPHTKKNTDSPQAPQQNTPGSSSSSNPQDAVPSTAETTIQSSGNASLGSLLTNDAAVSPVAFASIVTRSRVHPNIQMSLSESDGATTTGGNDEEDMSGNTASPVAASALDEEEEVGVGEEKKKKNKSLAWLLIVLRVLFVGAVLAAVRFVWHKRLQLFRFGALDTAEHDAEHEDSCDDDGLEQGSRHTFQGGSIRIVDIADEFGPVRAQPDVSGKRACMQSVEELQLKLTPAGQKKDVDNLSGWHESMKQLEQQQKRRDGSIDMGEPSLSVVDEKKVVRTQRQQRLQSIVELDININPSTTKKDINAWYKLNSNGK